MADNIYDSILEQIKDFELDALESVEVGYVEEVGDGIARISGLDNVRYNELVQFENGVAGIAFNLEKDNVGIIIMGAYDDIQEGDTVSALGRISSVPVGMGLVGRVVNALGEPIDGRGPVQFEEYYNIERIAPGVMERRSVDRPVQTRHPGDRYHDSYRPGPARADHWRSADRQDRCRPRYNRQPTRRGPVLHLCGNWQAAR